MYYKNEKSNFSSADSLLVPFVMMKYKYYKNENISGTNLLLVPYDEV